MSQKEVALLLLCDNNLLNNWAFGSKGYKRVKSDRFCDCGN